MVAKIALAAAALFAVSVSADGSRGNGLASLLKKRQLGAPPTVPPGAAEQCNAQCTKAANDVQCGDLTCICVTATLQDMADCYSCITPFVQSQDPTWNNDIATTLGELVAGCNEAGMSVSPPKFNGAVVPPVTGIPTDIPTDTGVFPSETDSGLSTPPGTSAPPVGTHSTAGGSSPTSPAAGQSSPAPASQSSSSPSGQVPGLGNSGFTSASSSVVAFAGVAGVAVLMMAF